MGGFHPVGFIVDHHIVAFARDGVVERVAEEPVGTMVGLCGQEILIARRVVEGVVHVQTLGFKLPTTFHDGGAMLEAHPEFERFGCGKVLCVVRAHVEIHHPIVRPPPLCPVRRRLAGGGKRHFVKAIPPIAPHHLPLAALRKFRHTVVAQRVAVQPTLMVHIGIEARREHPWRKEHIASVEVQFRIRLVAASVLDLHFVAASRVVLAVKLIVVGAHFRVSHRGRRRFTGRSLKDTEGVGRKT